MFGHLRTLRMGLAAGAMLAAMLPSKSHAAQLFAPEANIASAAPGIAPTANKRMVEIQREMGNRSIRLVKIDMSALKGKSLEFRIKDGLERKANLDRIEKLSATSYVWFGKLEGIEGDAILVVNGNEIEGSVDDGKNIYRIRSVGDGLHALIEIDQSKLPEGKDAVNPQTNGVLPNIPMPLSGERMGSDTSVIRVGVAYTATAETAQGGSAAMLNMINLAISQTNQGYRNSQIKARLQLAGTVKMTYTDTGDYGRILNDFRINGDGKMDNIHTLRNSWNADISVLIINNTQYCGMAYVMASADYAFALVHYSCATGSYTFGHEIGHLYGARHNVEDDAASTPFAYGHGFRQPSWRTVMAYNCASNCPRINYWSNPKITYGGVAMGTVDLQDNARVLNATAPILASFRNSIPGIWKYTGTPCSGSSCAGWQQLDNNRKAVAIASAAGNLYQLHNDGMIWKSTGVACSNGSCPGWTRIDANSNTMGIAADGGYLYQIQRDGKIYRWNGSAWQMLDNNPKGKSIAASGGNLYQMHNNGDVWRFTGTICSGSSCPGWTRIDANPNTKAITADGASLYQIQTTGAIWRYTNGTWTNLDNNSNSREIVAGGGSLYQLQADGKIWRYAANTWNMLDNNSTSVGLTADASTMYQLLADGRVYKFAGPVCNGSTCSGWQMLDNNSQTSAIDASGSTLYQLHGN